ESILSELDVDIESSTTITEVESSEKTGEISGGIDFKLFNLGSKAGEKDGESTEVSKQTYKIRNLKLFALKKLREFGVALVIDDFHYIDQKLQRTIIRSLKQPIFKGLRVIILAVPHRAYDS